MRAATSAGFALSGTTVGLFCHTPLVAVARNIGRKRALEDITHFHDDGAGFVEKVKGELEVWA